MLKIWLLLLGFFILFMVLIGWGIVFFFLLQDFLVLKDFQFVFIFLGIVFGGLLVMIINFYLEIDENVLFLRDQFLLIRFLKFNLVDCIFFVFCVGFGEEMLFRVGIQLWIGFYFIFVFFVVIYGYLYLRKWYVIKYGLMVLVFIFLLLLGKVEFGLWFCIVVYFVYDFILFYFWKDQNFVI